MEENCFCETDKYAYPSLYNRIFCCVCNKEKEILIKLNCCGKYVHKSCFITSSIIRRNNIINSKDTPETTNFSEIDICHYCTKPYDKRQFPNLLTSEGIQIKRKHRMFNIILITLWTIIMLFSTGNSLSDNILLGVYKNRGIELYKNKFIDNCEANYTGIYNTSKDIHDYCFDSFSDKNIWIPWMVTGSSVFGAFTIIAFMCLLFADDGRFPKPPIFVYEYIFTGDLCNIHTDFLIKDYKNSIEKCKKIYKSNSKKLIIPSIILIWQLVYLFLILGYNLWYIPSHTSPDTTEKEARKLAFYYIPILCFFNIFWLAIICLTIFIICVIVVLCIKCCNEYEEERRKIKNNMSLGNDNVKLYDMDVDNSLKKSNIV
jgi:hypothetical protein